MSLESNNAGIRIWNRITQKEEVEKVYGEEWVRWMYQARSGKLLANWVLTRPFFSKIYGRYQDTAASAKKIPQFIKDYSIPMELYEAGPFKSFNQFFIRKFKEGARLVEKASHRMPAFAEARYLVFPKIEKTSVFPVKGEYLTAEAILGNKKWAKVFEGGPMTIARLCPVDYHRFHFPDDGTFEDAYPIKGKLHSVNPVALKEKGDIFATNERFVSILNTKEFGRIAYVEVGATCVGRIVQSVLPVKGRQFLRGQEKGYFLFGGSTVIIFGEPGKFEFDADLVERSAAQQEVWIPFGNAIATKK